LGELYILNYRGSYSTINPGISRVDYKGSCRPTVSAQERKPLRQENSRLARLLGGDWKVVSRDSHRFRLFDTRGREVYSASGEYGSVYRAIDLRASGFSSGVYTVRFETDKGIQQRTWMIP
jgi:hypothetical protein